MTPYETLGVPPDADTAAIKAAYRTAAKTAHPDAGGSAEAFGALTHAYELLSDWERRANFDATGDDGGTRPDNTQAALLQSLAAAILNAISVAVQMGGNPFERDIVGIAKAEVRKRKAKAKKDQADFEKDAATTERAASKFIRIKDAPDNHIRDLLLGQARMIRSQIGVIEAQIGRDQALLELLDLYRFEADPAAPREPRGVRFTFEDLAARNSAYFARGDRL